MSVTSSCVLGHPTRQKKKARLRLRPEIRSRWIANLAGHVKRICRDLCRILWGAVLRCGQALM